MEQLLKKAGVAAGFLNVSKQTGIDISLLLQESVHESMAFIDEYACFLCLEFIVTGKT